MKKVLLADSHAHLMDSRLLDKSKEIVDHMEADCLAFIVEIGTGIQESKKALAFASNHNNVYCTLGVHPHYASEYTQEFEAFAKQSMPNSKIIAIGECGLDYHYDNSPRPVQREVFVAQIKLAYRLGLPMVIHSRDAFQDTLDIMKEHKKLLVNGVLLHCFGYGAEEARQLLAEFDCCFAFGGAITFPGKKMCQTTLQEALDVVPLNRVILETDCPYLAPVPMRGKTNEPKNVKFIAEFIAKQLGKSFAEVAEATLENTKRFFRIS